MKILHLYHDMMNLYGDYANVSAVKRILEKNGETVELDQRSFGDDVDISEYHFIFIGSGTEINQKVVLEDFQKYQQDLCEYIESGRPALLTGNSFEMLGESITDSSGKRYGGLQIFHFTVTEQNKKRLTADAVFDADFLDKPLVGFINKCSRIEGIEKPMFSVRLGLGNSENGGEGVRKNNLFCTHLTGPVLMKNPHFLAYIAELILGRTPDTSHLTYEKNGYEITLSELEKRIDNHA